MSARDPRLDRLDYRPDVHGLVEGPADAPPEIVRQALAIRCPDCNVNVFIERDDADLRGTAASGRGYVLKVAHDATCPWLADADQGERACVCGQPCVFPRGHSGPCSWELPVDKTGEKCPTCGSGKPHLHPAVQFGGEVQPCHDPWHRSTQLGQEAYKRLPSSLRYVAPGAEREAMERAKREASTVLKEALDGE